MEYGAGHQQPDWTGPAPRLRPLDLGQKLDAGIKLSMRNFWTLASIILVLLVPISLLQFLITVSTLPEDYTAGGAFGPGATPEGSEDPETSFIVGQGINWLLTVVSFFLVPAVCFKAIAHAYLGEKADARESLRYSFRRFHSILWILLLVTVVLFVLAFLGIFVMAIGALAPVMLIITIPAGLAPFLWVAVVWSLALPALMVEDARGTKALGRSFRLIRGRWWRTFGLEFLAGLLVWFISFVVAFLLFLLVFVLAGESSIASIGLTYLVNLAASLLTTPFFAAVLIVLYFDLRVRKEAFDLQVLADSIGGRAPAETAAPGRSMPWVAPPGTPPPPPPGWGPPQGPAPGWGAPQGAAPGWGAPPQQGPLAWGAPPPPPPSPAQAEPAAEPGGWEPPVPPEPPDRSST